MLALGLQNRQLISHRLGALIAGAKYAVEFEDRLKGRAQGGDPPGEGQIVLSSMRSKPWWVLVPPGGSMDAATCFKPMLAR